MKKNKKNQKNKNINLQKVLIKLMIKQIKKLNKSKINFKII